MCSISILNGINLPHWFRLGNRMHLGPHLEPTVVNVLTYLFSIELKCLNGKHAMFEWYSFNGRYHFCFYCCNQYLPMFNICIIKVMSLSLKKIYIQLNKEYKTVVAPLLVYPAGDCGCRCNPQWGSKKCFLILFESLNLDVMFQLSGLHVTLVSVTADRWFHPLLQHLSRLTGESAVDHRDWSKWRIDLLVTTYKNFLRNLCGGTCWKTWKFGSH